MKYIQIQNKFLTNRIKKKAIEDIKLYKETKNWTKKELADYLIYFKEDAKMSKLDGAVIDRVINILFDLELNKI